MLNDSWTFFFELLLDNLNFCVLPSISEDQCNTIVCRKTAYYLDCPRTWVQRYLLCVTLVVCMVPSLLLSYLSNPAIHSALLVQLTGIRYCNMKSNCTGGTVTISLKWLQYSVKVRDWDLLDQFLGLACLNGTIFEGICTSPLTFTFLPHSSGLYCLQNSLTLGNLNHADVLTELTAFSLMIYDWTWLLVDSVSMTFSLCRGH